MALSKTMKVIIVSALVAIFAVACIGCSGAGSSYNLNRDKSLKAKWGTVVQFKVDEKWTGSEDSLDSDDLAMASYREEKDDGTSGITVHIAIRNTNGKLYAYNKQTTYGDWLDYQEEYNTRTPQEQMEANTQHMSEAEKKKYSDIADVNTYSTRSNYSMTEIGSYDVSDTKFRLYKMSYDYQFNDAGYKTIKEKNPNVKQSGTAEYYYAIVKDGNHDMEVTASSEQLLKDFLGTFEVKW